jgi:hypothetical protein
MRTRLLASPAVVLALLVAGSAALRFWAATAVPTPWIAPDELIYAELGRSLYAHGTLALLGHRTSFFSLVYPALAGLPLSFSDVGLGYTVLKAVQAVVMSLAAVPVYLWGRRLVRPSLALLAAVLTLVLPGLVYSGLILTEVAFYPLLVLAVWAMAEALVRPTLARQALFVGAVLVAMATRLQAIALVPAFATALAFQPRRALRLWPTIAAFVAAAAAWSAWQLRNGGPATKLLGAYQAAGEVHYTVRDAARFVLYHLGDVVLFTGLVPVCALALLALLPPRSDEERAFVGAAVGTTLWLTVEVGIFASRHVGHLAERNLFALAPLLFLALAVWLERGAPRPPVRTAIVALAAVGAVLALPVASFVTAATIPDAPTLIPLYRLHVHAPSLSLEVVLDVAAAIAAAAFALVPRRLAWVLPAALVAALAAASLSASRVVAAQAKLVQPGTVGAHPRWIDAAARGPVTYLYTGDVYWNSVWESLFWNRRLRTVYDLLSAAVPGGLPQDSLGPLEDGTLVDKFGHRPPVTYVVGSDSLEFRGTRVADAGNGISLWRVHPPFRLAQWVQNVRFDGTVERHAKVFVYACRGGRLEVRLRAADAPTRVELLRHERRYLRRDLAAGETLAASIPAEPTQPGGRGLCSFDVFTDATVRVDELRFVAALL